MSDLRMKSIPHSLAKKSLPKIARTSWLKHTHNLFQNDGIMGVINLATFTIKKAQKNKT